MHIILMPGMDGTGVLFAPLAQALSSSASVQILSYPGNVSLTYEALVPTVLGALPTSDPFILVAESFSGPLALMVAAGRPPGLRGIILCASFVRNPVWWAPPALRHAISSFAFRLFPAFTQVKALLGGYGTPELRRLLAQAHAAVSPAVLASRARSILTVDVVPQLRVCPVPILYIRGSHDRVVPLRSLQLIQRELPSVQLFTVLGPHLVLQVQPSACAKAIVAFATSESG